MTTGAPGRPEEERFARPCVTGVGPQCGAGTGSGRETAEKSDELPNLRIAQAAKRRHLRAADPGANRAEQIGVGAAVREGAAVQGRAAIAAPLPGRTVTALTKLTEERLARTDGGRAAGKRIGGRDALAGANCARTQQGEDEDRKSA